MSARFPSKVLAFLSNSGSSKAYSLGHVIFESAVDKAGGLVDHFSDIGMRAVVVHEVWLVSCPVAEWFEYMC